MKTRALALVLALLLACLPTLAYAHPGQLDDKGCHTTHAGPVEFSRNLEDVEDEHWHCHEAETDASSENSTIYALSAVAIAALMLLVFTDVIDTDFQDGPQRETLPRGPARPAPLHGVP